MFQTFVTRAALQILEKFFLQFFNNFEFIFFYRQSEIKYYNLRVLQERNKFFFLMTLLKFLPTNNLLQIY